MLRTHVSEATWVASYSRMNLVACDKPGFCLCLWGTIAKMPWLWIPASLCLVDGLEQRMHFIYLRYHHCHNCQMSLVNQSLSLPESDAYFITIIITAEAGRISTSAMPSVQYIMTMDYSSYCSKALTFSKQKKHYINCCFDNLELTSSYVCL